LRGGEAVTEGRDPTRGVEGEALGETAIEDVDEAGPALSSLNRHPSRSSLLGSEAAPPQRLRARRSGGGAGECIDLSLELPHLPAQGLVLGRDALLAGGEMVVVLPPVEADLLGLVERADDEPNADREELDLGERDLDVPRDDETLVEDAVENVHEPRAARPVERAGTVERCVSPHARATQGRVGEKPRTWSPSRHQD